MQPLRLAPVNSLWDDAGLLNANELLVEAKVPLQWQLVNEAADVASNDCRVYTVRMTTIPSIESPSYKNITERCVVSVVTISPKFQVVIPRVVRERLGLRPGQKLQVIEHAGRVEFVPERSIRDLKGFVKGINTDVGREGDRL